MFPGPNGFEAFAVCVPSEDGEWQISDVVAESESSLATKLRAMYPAADLHEAKQKAHKRYSKVTSGPPSATSALIESITDHLIEAKNVILQGPPGTGKTYLSTEVICRLGGGLSRSALDDARFSKLLTDAGGNISTLLDRQELGEVLWERVQLHPTFAYDDFVRE